MQTESITRRGERCDFLHLLVDCPAPIGERFSLLQFVNSYDINCLTVDIFQSDNMAITRAIINFILSTGMYLNFTSRN